MRVATWVRCRYYRSKREAVSKVQPIRIQQTCETIHETAVAQCKNTSTLSLTSVLQNKPSKLSSQVKVPSQTTMAHQAGMSQGILVSIATAHKGMVWLAPRLAAFDRYPSPVLGQILKYWYMNRIPNTC